jgi:hypothetical protein
MPIIPPRTTISYEECSAIRRLSAGTTRIPRRTTILREDLPAKGQLTLEAPRNHGVVETGLVETLPGRGTYVVGQDK